jgi:hypothetical protein
MINRLNDSFSRLYPNIFNAKLLSMNIFQLLKMKAPNTNLQS